MSQELNASGKERLSQVAYLGFKIYQKEPKKCPYWAIWVHGVSMRGPFALKPTQMMNKHL